MVNLQKNLLEAFLTTILIIFIIISFLWIKYNGINDANSMIAIATIVYAIFTFFMFWNMKSSSETQVRPLLITNFDNKFNLHLLNKIEKNIAKDVKLRVKAITIKNYKEENKFTIFLRKIGLGYVREWTIWDYLGSYKEDYEVFEKDVKIDLSDYLIKSINLEFWKSSSGKDIIKTDSEKGEVFKLLIYLSYNSLLDVTYGLKDQYLIKIKRDGTEIKKEIY
jgi:hypothetical protein